MPGEMQATASLLLAAALLVFGQFPWVRVGAPCAQKQWHPQSGQGAPFGIANQSHSFAKGNRQRSHAHTTGLLANVNSRTFPMEYTTGLNLLLLGMLVFALPHDTDWFMTPLQDAASLECFATRSILGPSFAGKA